MELDHKSDFHVTTQLHLGVNCSGHLLNLLDPFLLHHLDRGQDVLFKGFKGKGRPKKNTDLMANLWTLFRVVPLYSQTVLLGCVDINKIRIQSL